jgi:hypothetical protein
VQRIQRIAGVLLLIGLLAGSGIGFAVGQSLKSVPKDITSTDFSNGGAFSPGCACAHPAATFSLTLSRQARVDVSIETPAGGTVVQLVHGRTVKGLLPLRWDGTSSTGARVSDGPYRVRVRFVGVRTLLLANVITVDSHPPVISGLTPPASPLTPGTGGDLGVYRVALASNEPASARLAVYHVAADGSVARAWWSDPPAALTPGHTTLFAWPVADGSATTPASPGTYVIGYEAVDSAGNVARVPTGFGAGELGGSVVARVRTVEIDGAGAILTAATQPTVSLLRLTTTAAGTSVWKGSTAPPAPTGPGLYRVVAAVAGGTAEAVVAVPGTARVLVVVPTYTWQAANPYDGDGDGLPDVTLGRQSLARPLGDLAGADIDALAGAARHVLGARRPAGAITDQALEDLGVARSVRTLVLVGVDVWTPGLVARLKAFRARGGRIQLIGSPLGQPAARDGDAIIVSATPGRAPITLRTR